MTALADSPVAAPSKHTPLAQWRGPIIMGAIALLSLVAFGLGSAAGAEATFSVARPTDAFQIPNFGVPARFTAILLSVLALGFAGLAAWAVATKRKLGWWLPVVFTVSVLGAFLTWAGAGRDSTNVQITGLLAGAVVLSIPLVFGSLAGVVCERSGVINIAIEGQLLFGAFLAALVASGVAHTLMGQGVERSTALERGAYVGLIVAPLAGAMVGAALALFAVRYWVDQIVVGVVLNVLVIGLTNFLFGSVMRNNPELNQATSMGRQPIPLLSEIPIIGPVLFNHTVLVYIMYVVVIALHLMLFKSRWGLRIRAVGEHPKAADTVGIKVNRTRVRNVIFGGAIAGLGGAFFTVAAGLAFGKEMTAGKGFIALAAMILGRWSPKGALAAALLFGFAGALGDQLGIMGSALPSQFLLMLPYLATLFAVAGLVGHARPPAAGGKPYKK